MGNNEMVSVIIPTYNSEKFIKKTIYSVLNQTYKNFEIIVIDDCSTDKTEGVIKGIGSSKIRFYMQEKNAGAAIARNKGLDLATGKYVAFLDSDDVWEKKKLEKQLEFMREQKADFCFCAYDLVNANMKVIKRRIKIKNHVTYSDLLTKTYIATPTVVINREKLGKMRMPLRRTGQDYAFWLLLLKNFDAYGLDEVLVHVCKRAGSLSKNKMQNLLDIYEIQTDNENIKKISVLINIAEYAVFTLKKRFF